MFTSFAGNPNPPVFNSQVLSKSQTSYKISWTTESHSPVEEYRLLYRKVPVSKHCGQRTEIQWLSVYELP